LSTATAYAVPLSVTRGPAPTTIAVGLPIKAELTRVGEPCPKAGRQKHSDPSSTVHFILLQYATIPDRYSPRPEVVSVDIWASQKTAMEGGVGRRGRRGQPELGDFISRLI